MDDDVATTAVENNLRLFTSFARKLAQDDLAVYASFAHKFAQWLSDPRAYYSQARPEIVKLLIIAHTTCLRNVAADPTVPFNISSYLGHPMVEPYSSMLRAVHPHREHFIEPDLRAQIKYLLRTITAPPHPPWGSSSFDQPLGAISPAPSTSMDKSALPRIVTSQIPPWLPPASAMTPLSSTGAAAASYTAAPPTQQVLPLASAIILNGQQLNRSTTVRSPSFSSAFSIEAYKHPVVPDSPAKPPLIPESAVTSPQVTENSNSANPSVEASHILFSESSLAPSTTPHPPATVPAELPVLRQLRKKKKKFEVKLDSLIQADIQQLQKRGSFSVKQEVMDDAKLLEISTSNLVESAQDCNPQSLASTTIEHPFERITVGQTNLDQASALVDSTAVPVPPQLDIFDHQTPMEVDLPSPTEQNIAFVVASAGTPARQGSPEVELDAMISQDHLAAGVGEGQDLDVVMHGFTDTGILSPKLSDGIPDGIDSNNHATPVTVSSPYTAPILHQTSPQPSASGVSEAVPPSFVVPAVIEDKGTLHTFGPQARILIQEVGHSSGCKIEFKLEMTQDLDRDRAQKVWKNRRESTEDLTKSICYTLSCYPADKTPEQFALLPSLWPTAGDLCIRMMYSGRRTSFPLSPPLGLAPNGMVDLSDFLTEGMDPIELVHSSDTDTSGYQFVLRAHYPTNAQLKQVAQRHQKDRKWKDWLLKMSQPFEVSIST